MLDREHEIALVDAAVEAACEGSGRVIVVAGEAGIGKTELLRLACRRAEQRMRVLAARGGEIEQEFPFGLVRQLFETEVARKSARARRLLLGGAAATAAAVIAVDGPIGAAAGIDLGQALHGLYWLCSNLADERPLALAVDDAHWGDRESLRWLGYMANRISDLPLVLVVASRAGERPVDPQSFDAIEASPSTTLVRLEPLTEVASATVVRGIGDADADADFCRACHVASGGNPFYLRELVSETARQRISPVAANADRVSGLSPPAISRSTLARLARLPHPTGQLAQAVAVLGLDVEVRHAAALAGVSIEDAERGADILAAAGIFAPGRPLNFIHPVVAAATHADMPAGMQSDAHARAASLLAGEAADPGVVGSHLLLVDPSGDPLVRDRLEHASAEALARGAPETAARFLRRAADEGGASDVRAALLVQLGRAELAAGAPSAIESLSEAFARAGDPALIAESARLLGTVLGFLGRFDDAEEVTARAIQRLNGAEDDSLVLGLEAVRLTFTAFDSRYAADVAARLPALIETAKRGDDGGRLIFSVGAMRAALELGRARDVRSLVELAIAGDGFESPQLADSISSGQLACALAFVDELDAADSLLEALLENARARNSVVNYVTALVWRGWVALRRGYVRSAVADERAALELCRQHGLAFPLPWAQTFLAHALLESGRIEEAVALAESMPVDELPLQALQGMAHDVRGRVRLAVGRRTEAIADFRAAGELHRLIGQLNPNATHWASSAAVALGRGSDLAEELAATELDLATRSGCPRAVGVALRARGLLASGDAALRLMREAAEILHAGPAQLEYARTLVCVGAELRRQGRRSLAREPLREAIDIADRLAAERLADEAGAELAAAGGRPRRRRLTGAEALTPTEERVAQLAVAGLRNKEIAQALFVSQKTVEMHLGNAYRKLAIRGRGDLAHSLESSSTGEVTRR